MMSSDALLESARNGDRRSLARMITIVENDLSGAGEILESLQLDAAPPVIGITGPPGAGKSTLINALITSFTQAGETVAVIAVDPTSPFTSGSLLGDRLRMSEHFTNQNVFIRSLATRGSLGGLSAKSIEVADVLRASGFNRIIVETVGVGQSEVEIAGLADVTVLVLVPEAGDDIQAIKSGIMEIADVYVVNKSDRPGADHFAKNLHNLVAAPHEGHVSRAVVKTIAAKEEGIAELIKAIDERTIATTDPGKKAFLYTEKAWRIIGQRRMKDIQRSNLSAEIENRIRKGGFNLYKFCAEF